MQVRDILDSHINYTDDDIHDDDVYHMEKILYKCIYDNDLHVSNDMVYLDDGGFGIPDHSNDEGYVLYEDTGEHDRYSIKPVNPHIIKYPVPLDACPEESKEINRIERILFRSRSKERSSSPKYNEYKPLTRDNSNGGKVFPSSSSDHHHHILQNNPFNQNNTQNGLNNGNSSRYDPLRDIRMRLVDLHNTINNEIEWCDERCEMNDMINRLQDTLNRYQHARPINRNTSNNNKLHINNTTNNVLHTTTTNNNILHIHTRNNTHNIDTRDYADNTRKKKTQHEVGGESQTYKDLHSVLKQHNFSCDLINSLH